MQPKDRLQHYELISQLGHGGFSEVFLANDTRLDIEVAVKVLLPQHSASEDTVRRFQLGAQAAARLQHPNIVRVLYMGEVKSQRIYFNVMELLPDGTLLDRIYDEVLTLEDAAQDFVQIADAIGFAHEQGYIHRDIKPANILYDEEQKPVVTDFDLSRVVGQTRMTEPGMAMGTVHYISPEQASGEDVTPEADVYSLGAMLFQMLTYQYPFGDPNPLQILDMHYRAKVPSASKVNPKLPRRVDRVIQKAMAKKPQQRFHSARELSDALLDALPKSDQIRRVALRTDTLIEEDTFKLHVDCGLTILNGEMAGRHILLEQDKLLVGYTEEDGNDLGLFDDYASTHHGRFERQENGWVYIDLESTNGTSLVKPRGDKKPLAPNQPLTLSFGDVLEIGYTWLRFDYNSV